MAYLFHKIKITTCRCFQRHFFMLGKWFMDRLQLCQSAVLFLSSLVCHKSCLFPIHFFFLAFLFFILPPASQYWRRWVIWRWKNILWWPHSLEGLSVLSNVSCQCASEEGHAGTSVRLRSYSAPSRDGRGRWLRKHEVLVPPERLCVWSTTQPLSPGACPALSISPQK